ncbi:MAG: Sec-independent protein translocase subunit TatA/TatB [Actinomycetota bacterium]
MFNIGPLELMVILIVALLVVGPAKLPELGRSIGRGLREFRKAQDEVQRTLRLSLDDDEPPSRPMRAATSPTATETNGDGELGDPSTADEAPGAREPAEPDAPSGADDVARALGRGLAELRRAKEELQNSFRVDLNDDGGGNGSRAG